MKSKFPNQLGRKFPIYCKDMIKFSFGRGVRVVYGDGLENRCSRQGTVGSNPTPSAISVPQEKPSSAGVDPGDLARSR